MSDGPDSAVVPRQSISDAIIELVKKQGILGLVLIALMYFIWDTSKKAREDNGRLIPVMEKNTETVAKNSVLLDQTIKSNEKNNSIFDRNTSIIERSTAIIERLERRLDERLEIQTEKLGKGVR